MTPFSSVAMLEKLALLKIASCSAPVLSNEFCRRTSVTPVGLPVSSATGERIGVVGKADLRAKGDADQAKDARPFLWFMKARQPCGRLETGSVENRVIVPIRLCAGVPKRRMRVARDRREPESDDFGRVQARQEQHAYGADEVAHRQRQELD